MGSKSFLFFACIFLTLFSCKTDPKATDSCGDGILDPAEECDTTIGANSCASLGHYRIDGALGCKADCTFDRTDCGGRCGDTVVDLGDGEECDGPSLNGYLCETLGFTGGTLACGNDCDFDTTGCQNSCGNGLRETGEACDDGSPEAGDGCSATCAVEPGWTCDVASPTVCTPICGDGQALGAEPCDGADLGQKTCLTLNYYGGTLACNGDCTLDLTSCEAAGTCGDGAAQVADGEVCDGDDLQLASCVSQGYYGGTIACDTDCTFLLTDCALYGRCGDNTLHAASGEACDGTALGTDSCLSLGYYGGSIACAGNCQYDLAPCIAAGRCGDGVLQSASSELCDTTDFGSSVSCISQANLAYGDLTCTGNCRTIDTTACYGKRYLSAAGTFASSCAIDVDNKAWCWGHGSVGTLGNGANSNSIIPVPTSGDYNFTQISEGGDGHFCGLISGGAIRCWGLNDNGQLGDNTTTNRNVPTLVSSAAAYIQVASGYYHNCALTSNNQVLCWGLNADGQLGSGNTTPRWAPYAITTGSYNFVAAGGYHSCALDTTGKAWCWGYNASGQLGNNSTVSSTSRVAVSGLLVFSKIYAGAQNTCATTSGGSTYCWGEGGSGQLGRGSTTDSSIPVLVSGGLSFAQLAIYSSHVCGITPGGALYCWGLNTVGQLGIGNTTNQTTPQEVTPLTRYSHVGLGANHSCAVQGSGGLWCWGENASSQLGNGGTTSSTVPVLTSSP